MAKAHRPLEQLSRLGVLVQVCLAGQVKPVLSPLVQQVGSRQQRMGCRRVVQPHALAEEYFSGSRF
jgi:hypothetical protein